MPKISIYPAPVYVAEFDDGTVGRASFYQLAGKPFDFERGLRTCATIFSRPEGAPAAGTYEARAVVNGYVEHDIADQPWVRVRDPRFERSAEVISIKRKSWQQRASEARQALERGDAGAALAILQQVA